MVVEAGADPTLNVGYIQAAMLASTAKYPLALNPQGGFVGIGKSAPATALDVAGTVTSTGVSVTGNASVSGSLSANTAVVTSTLRAGATTLTGALAVNGAIQGSNITGTGATINGPLTANSFAATTANITSALTSGPFSATAGTISGNLTVTGTATTGGLTAATVSTPGDLVAQNANTSNLTNAFTVTSSNVASIIGQFSGGVTSKTLTASNISVLTDITAATYYNLPLSTLTNPGIVQLNDSSNSYSITQAPSANILRQVSQIATAANTLANALSNCQWTTYDTSNVCTSLFGNIGIGTAAPSQKLSVVGSASITNAIKPPASIGAPLLALIGSNVADASNYILFNNAGGSNYNQFTLKNDMQLVYSTSNGLGGFTIGPSNMTAMGCIRMDSNGWVGIGTSRPAGPLQVMTAKTAASLVVNSNANVGIGTMIPRSQLHVYNGSMTVSENRQSLSTATLNIQYGNNQPLTFQQNNDGTAMIQSPGSLLATATGDLIYSTVNTGINLERMRIAQNGNVGIGTSVAAQYNTQLLVAGNVQVGQITNAALAVDTLTAPRVGIVAQNNNYPQISAITGTPIIFSHMNQTSVLTNISLATLTERMRINGNGYLGLGTQSPTELLHVNGGNVRIDSTTTPTLSLMNKATTGGLVAINMSTSNTLYPTARLSCAEFNASNSAHLAFSTKSPSNADGNPLVERMRITGYGNVGIGTSAPDLSHSLHVVGNTLMDGVMRTSGFFRAQWTRSYAAYALTAASGDTLGSAPTLTNVSSLMSYSAASLLLLTSSPVTSGVFNFPMKGMYSISLVCDASSSQNEVALAVQNNTFGGLAAKNLRVVRGFTFGNALQLEFIDCYNKDEQIQPILYVFASKATTTFTFTVTLIHALL